MRTWKALGGVPILGMAGTFVDNITASNAIGLYNCANPPPRTALEELMTLPSGHHENIRVLVADSNQIQSQLLGSALRRQANLKVTCCRSDLAECLAALSVAPADVVLIGNGVHERAMTYELIRGIHSTYPRLALVLLLDSYDRDLVVDAIRSGARGLFSLTAQPFKALCRCISSVHKGQVWASSEQLLYVIEALVNPTPRIVTARGDVLLTAREEQVVNLVAEGISNREIAQQLCVKENTVKKCLLHIYDKLGVCNRVELVLYALSHRGGSSRPLETPGAISQPARSVRGPAGTVSTHAVASVIPIALDRFETVS